MPELRQTGFNEMPGSAGIVVPNEPHMACVLLLDTSSSICADRICLLYTYTSPRDKRQYRMTYSA